MERLNTAVIILNVQIKFNTELYLLEKDLVNCKAKKLLNKEENYNQEKA